MEGSLSDGSKGDTSTPICDISRLDKINSQGIGIDLNLCAAHQSPFSAATITGKFNASRGLTDPHSCQAAERGHLQAVILLVQQCERLKIKQGTIMAHDTALCKAARDGDSEMAWALLRHDKIDPKLDNRCFQAPLLLAEKGAHTLVIDTLVADRRVTPYSSMTSLSFAKNDSIRRVIQSKIDDLNTRHGQIPAWLTKGSVGAWLKCQL